MKKYKFHKLIISALLSSILVLSGCGMLPEAEKFAINALEANTTHKAIITPPPPALKAKSTPGITQKHGLAKQHLLTRQPEPTITQANQLMQKGRRAAAADVYYRASFRYPSPQRERIMLQAAEISASLGDKQHTAGYLHKVNKHSLTPLNQIRYNYVNALLAVHNRQPNQALKLLPGNSSRLPKGLNEKIDLVRKRAIDMGGRPPQNLAAANHARKIVPTVPTVRSQPTSNSANNRTGTQPYQQHRTQNNQQAMQQQGQQSQTPTPGFILPKTTNKIAVLLPNKGSLGKVGDEIYQGIKDAQTSYGNGVLSKRYDVDKTNVVQQYQQAVNDGADIVVGPLDKGSLAALTTQPQLLQVPVLSLNYLPGSNNLPHTLYQFGLSPEDEARQIATFALSRGQQNGVIMTPDSSWGKRLANAFAQTYQQRGGKILSAEFYPNAKPSSYLKRVQKLLANGQGANMVFLAASPTQARLLRPLLKDQAGILPVYATSHIFSGREASNKDIDLDGIIYTEIPYILKKTDQGSLNNLKFPRLYALGMDAVTVAKNLAPLVQNHVLPGQTGQISIDPQRRLQRRLEFATFINGQPHSLGQ